MPLGATLDDSGQLILGAYGNPRLEPFIPYVRPPARRDAWLMRTPSREPIRIGGERLHTWIADKQAAHPRLTTLLGGDTLDMLTIPGGRTIGSPGRLRDELFYENYSLTPKWLDNVPTTMDETLAGSVDEANRIKAVFDDEMKKDMANTLDGGHNELPLHLTHTAEGVVDPVFGMDRPTTILMEDGTVNRLDDLMIGKVGPSLGAGRWETLDQGVINEFILWRNKWRKSRAEIEQSLGANPLAWNYETLANDNVLSHQQRALANDIKDLGENLIEFKNVRTWSEFLEELDNMFPAVGSGADAAEFITRIRNADALDTFISSLLEDAQQGNLSTGLDPIRFESFGENFYPEQSNALRWENEVAPFTFSFWSGEVGPGGVSYTSIRKSIEELQELIMDASNPFRTLDDLPGQGGDVVVWNNWTDDPMWEAGLLGMTSMSARLILISRIGILYLNLMNFFQDSVS